MGKSASTTFLAKKQLMKACRLRFLICPRVNPTQQPGQDLLAVRLLGLCGLGGVPGGGFGAVRMKPLISLASRWVMGFADRSRHCCLKSSEGNCAVTNDALKRAANSLFAWGT